MSLSIEKAIFRFLKGTPAVTALVASRIYYRKAPQAPTYPLIVYSRVSGRRVASLSGDSGLADPQFQFSSQAKTADLAREVCEKVSDAVSGYQGLMGSLPVHASVTENEDELYYEAIDVHQSSVDAFLSHPTGD